MGRIGRRIFWVLLPCLLLIGQVALAAEFWKETPMWIDYDNPGLRIARQVVIYPMEYADSDIPIDSYALSAARSGMGNWNWSSAAMLGLGYSDGRSVEDLAAEVKGKADLFIVSQVIDQGYEHNYSPRTTKPVEMHERREVSFRDSNYVDYDYYYTERHTVPEQEAVIYYAYFVHFIYDTNGALVAVYPDHGTDRKSRRSLYERNAEYFFKKVLPVMVRMSTEDKAGRR